ncbi:MAG: hypothetical protein AB1758_21025, partial [Candidatus Eremiobacterota bacterium]
MLLLAGVPFLTVSLTAPALTGAVGAASAAALETWFGRSAWLLPWLTFGWGVRLTAPGLLPELKLGWPTLLLWLDLTL